MTESIEMEVYKAIVDGDITLFSSPIKEDELLKKTQQNNNILHIAAQQERIHFIKAALNNFPNNTRESLICQQNNKGNTPLHIAAEFGDETVVELLRQYYEDEVVGVELRRVLPWRMVNSDGNTPAHVALLYGHFLVARYLVEKDVYIAGMVNNSKETLLHLAIQYHIHGTLEEDLCPIIDLLLKTQSSVACWVDDKGSTPLHIATSLKPPHCLRAINAILATCPEAAEVHHEPSGQCMLHLLSNHQVQSYEEGIELLNIRGLKALRNCKNQLGDTPLHVAAMNNDRNMVRVLLRFEPNLNIQNKNGVMAGSLVQQLCVVPLDQIGNGEILVEGRRKFTLEESEAAKHGLLDVPLLRKKVEMMGMKFLFSQTPDGANILHLLTTRSMFGLILYEEAETFFGEVIEKWPSLISEKDNKGNTPVHIIAKRTFGPARLLEMCHDKSREEAPLRVINGEGNTPLHMAAKAGRIIAARKLVELDEEVAGYVNHRKETPLHMLCHYKPGPEWEYSDDPARDYTDVEDLVSSMINGNVGLPYTKDEDDQIPLFRAIQDRNFIMMEILYLKFPSTAFIRDLKGRTVWHMFVYRRPSEKGSSPTDPGETVEPVFDYSLSKLITVLSKQQGSLSGMPMAYKDNDGNTPLHLAIQNRHFEFAQYLLEYARMRDIVFSDDERKAYLAMENNNRISAYDLIGSAEHLPLEFENYLWSIGNLLYGHRTTKIYDYANTIGVVGALLVTITFTAAFTVPRSLDNSVTELHSSFKRQHLRCSWCQTCWRCARQ